MDWNEEREGIKAYQIVGRLQKVETIIEKKKTRDSAAVVDCNLGLEDSFKSSPRAGFDLVEDPSKGEL